MKTKHTKGNWKIGKWGHIVDEKNNNVLIAGATIPVISTEESKANAKLIAAAPELLEALQGFVSDFETDFVVQDGRIVDDPSILLRVNYKRAKEAIKKATA